MLPTRSSTVTGSWSLSGATARTLWLSGYLDMDFWVSKLTITFAPGVNSHISVGISPSLRRDRWTERTTRACIRASLQFPRYETGGRLVTSEQQNNGQYIKGRGYIHTIVLPSASDGLFLVG